MWYKQILASFYTIIYSQVKQKKQHEHLPSDPEQAGEFFQCSVGIMIQYPVCKDLSKLYALLVKAVDIPEEALEHKLVLIM